MFKKLKRFLMTPKQRDLDTIMSIEGQLSLNEAEVLYEMAQSISENSVIVEIGSYRGRSTVALGLGALSGNGNRVYAIDPHLEFIGALGGAFGPVDQEILYKNLSDARVGKIVQVVSLPSVSVSRAWEQKNIGLLWVDGDHRYTAVKADYLAWSPYLVEGGWILFHDSFMDDVKRLIDEVVQRSEVVFAKQVGQIGIYKYMKG
ncbi:MAG: class I SAM-dependent methyltransferase [Candidatus Kuenenia stuttgartiensis]|nr:class I SAM-dependent methyltransferase [Candidatus Kuenenia stuttgartiensis]